MVKPDGLLGEVVPVGPDSPSDVTEDFLGEIGFESAPDPGPISALVSDSILSFFPDNDDDPITSAAIFLRRAVAVCSHSGIWLRGSVSYGECLLTQHSNGLIALGVPIVEAYKWEQNQDWIGGMLAPSAAREIKRLVDHFRRQDLIEEAKPGNRNVLVAYDVPLKEQFPSDCPTLAINLTVVDSLSRASFFQLPPLPTPSTDSRAARKYENTRRFFAALE